MIVANWTCKFLSINSSRLKLALLCPLLSCTLASVRSVEAQQQQAQQTLNYADDNWLNRRYDWVLYLEPEALPNYLNYPSSGLSSAVKIKVDYRLTPRISHLDSSEHKHYENLWYHDARAIGCCKEIDKLPFKNYWQGAICVPATSDAFSNPGAIANAIIRLLLDVSLLSNSLVLVLAPPQQESAICDQLGQFKFFRTDDMGLDNGPVIHLCVTSGEMRDRTFLIFEPKK